MENTEIKQNLLTGEALKDYKRCLSLLRLKYILESRDDAELESRLKAIGHKNNYTALPK